MRPYELNDAKLMSHLDQMVEVTFQDLTSQFMLLPRGSSFVTYDRFLAGYETLRLATDGFQVVDVKRCWDALKKRSTAFLALRSILGITAPEWQDLAEEITGVRIPSGWGRATEGKIKRSPDFFNTRSGMTPIVIERTTMLLKAACHFLDAGVPKAPDGLMHRLDKIDTTEGVESVRYVAHNHVPYAVLLYERYLGRPFASHRDAVSELVGEVMENAIEEQLHVKGIPFRKTGRAERVPGYEQAPDFFIPDELSPSVIIEAKITGDDGTARDKVARILRLAHMRDQRQRDGLPSFQVVACIDGRGFGVRRQDMRDLLIATEGKVFTAASIKDLVPHTGLVNFAPRR